MDEARFFELIDEARDGSQPTSPSADPVTLAGLLVDVDDDELVGFSAEYERQMTRLNDWRVWGAGYVAQGGMSDDGFAYFRSWIIGKGEDAVGQALTDPDGLVDFLADGEELSNEELQYAAFDQLEDRGLEETAATSAAGEDGAPTGEPFDEATVEADFPRLATWFAAQV
ncbi:MAG: polymerase [Marmoricola sp.]|nr:polymerase [Marmoricola sp.]